MCIGCHKMNSAGTNSTARNHKTQIRLVALSAHSTATIHTGGRLGVRGPDLCYHDHGLHDPPRSLVKRRFLDDDMLTSFI